MIDGDMLQLCIGKKRGYLAQADGIAITYDEYTEMTKCFCYKTILTWGFYSQMWFFHST